MPFSRRDSVPPPKKRLTIFSLQPSGRFHDWLDFRRTPKNGNASGERSGGDSCLNRCRAGYIATCALCETVPYVASAAVYRIQVSQVVPFCLAGFILMLFFGPRRSSHTMG